jgi:hypothetical protein
MFSLQNSVPGPAKGFFKTRKKGGSVEATALDLKIRKF